MSRAGRPLHFLGWILGGWVAARAGVMVLPLLWQGAPLPTEPEPMLAEAREADERRRVVKRAGLAAVMQRRVVANSPSIVAMASLARTAAQVPGSDEPPRTSLPVIREEPRPADRRSEPDAMLAAANAPSRWSGTAWLLWRPEGIGGLAQGPLLGGSQMGARIDYRLIGTAERSLSLYGRASRAMARPFAEEVALGIALRPVRGLPVSLLAERRIALGQGGRNGFALLAAGGMGPRAVASRLALEGYAQAGIVGLPGMDRFVDGRLSLDYRLGKAVAGPDLALGMAVNGSAQPGATRLDIGPQLRLRLPVAGRHLRLSAEWRERVAGDARPARGPALTLVTDF